MNEAIGQVYVLQSVQYLSAISFLSADHCLHSVFVCVVRFFSFVKYCAMFVTHTHTHTHTHTVSRNLCSYSAPYSSLTC